MNQPENRAQATERLRIRRWRFEQFVRLGFTESDSAVLAKTTVGVAMVRRLISAGCPTETASRIVL
jgi:hypothetical protein